MCLLSLLPRPAILKAIIARIIPLRRRGIFPVDFHFSFTSYTFPYDTYLSLYICAAIFEPCLMLSGLFILRSYILSSSSTAKAEIWQVDGEIYSVRHRCFCIVHIVF
ncbi:unnamed protein product [Albugo candida]|uniref:Uncharacterized protein n=1 Tax=Albugo candida TaxID=65357 RepID=A0A024GP67_9STRA|nr:unnamed protein product [Albugo candida]|eukprot:CCI48326.1 unnamed protein product [Albugo candida]